jgi:hypothetical protein
VATFYWHNKKSPQLFIYITTITMLTITQHNGHVIGITDGNAPETLTTARLVVRQSTLDADVILIDDDNANIRYVASYFSLCIVNGEGTDVYHPENAQSAVIALSTLDNFRT